MNLNDTKTKSSILPKTSETFISDLFFHVFKQYTVLHSPITIDIMKSVENEFKYILHILKAAGKLNSDCKDIKNDFIDIFKISFSDSGISKAVYRSSFRRMSYFCIVSKISKDISQNVEEEELYTASKEFIIYFIKECTLRIMHEMYNKMDAFFIKLLKKKFNEVLKNEKQADELVMGLFFEDPNCVFQNYLSYFIYCFIYKNFLTILNEDFGKDTLSE